MSLLLQILINGLLIGAVYSLVASGFSLIYSTCKIFHFAHGAIVTFAAYLLYFLFSVKGVNLWISIILVVILSAILGLAINLLVYRQLRKIKASNVILLISSVALLILLESLILILFGADIKMISFTKVEMGQNVLGAIITPLQITFLITSIALFLAFFIFLKKSKLGKSIRAVSDNIHVAEIMGISSEKIYNLVFIIGSAIAGVAGIFIGLEQNLEPVMGANIMIKGFTASIIGGIGSVPGAILGSFLLGLIENVSMWFLPAGYKDAITFTILLIFLLFKPEGILGIKKTKEKN